MAMKADHRGSASYIAEVHQPFGINMHEPYIVTISGWPCMHSFIIMPWDDHALLRQ
jgi:hypothetical protein